MDEINYKEKELVYEKKTGSICSSNCLNHWSQYGGHPIYKVCVEDVYQESTFSFDRDLSPVK